MEYYSFDANPLDWISKDELHAQLVDMEEHYDIHWFDDKHGAIYWPDSGTVLPLHRKQ